MTQTAADPKRILVIATRQIGDVLLTTPLLRSLRHAYPEATIDLLGYTNKCGMLAGNHDLNHIITIVEKPSLKQFWQLAKRIYRRYDLAISTLSGDKPHFYAWLAAKKRIGLVDDMSKKTAWKRASCEHWYVLDNLNTHTVLQNLTLLNNLGIDKQASITLPRTETPVQLPPQPYAVIHPFPMWHYKRWTEQGWQQVIEHLLQRDLHVVISGGPAEAEKTFCNTLAQDFDKRVINLAGQTTLGTLSDYLRHARCFIGPDTSITHMAAAAGCPTIALFGPSNAIKWGPWPANYLHLKNPFVKKQYPWQQQHNVILMQANQRDCFPCYQEGCDRHKASFSECLQTLEISIVIEAIDHALDDGESQS